MVKICRKYVYLTEDEFDDLLYDYKLAVRVLFLNTKRGTIRGIIVNPYTGAELGGFYLNSKGVCIMRKETYFKIVSKTQ